MFMELNPLQVVKASVLDMFVFNDRVVFLDEITVREVGMARRVAAHVARRTVFARWHRFFHSHRKCRTEAA